EGPLPLTKNEGRPQVGFLDDGGRHVSEGDRDDVGDGLEPLGAQPVPDEPLAPVADDGISGVELVGQIRCDWRHRSVLLSGREATTDGSGGFYDVSTRRAAGIVRLAGTRR